MTNTIALHVDAKMPEQWAHKKRKKKEEEKNNCRFYGIHTNRETNLNFDGSFQIILTIAHAFGMGRPPTEKETVNFPCH